MLGAGTLPGLFETVALLLTAALQALTAQELRRIRRDAATREELRKRLET